jgi:ADP-dependent NAD(P)H-hydrate dehydratase / NAD(P)H-hydrate epimerase
MKILTSAQIRELDNYAINKLGISGLVLMENAGRSVYEAIRATVKHKLKGETIFVICGKGNNGGDGFVVARHLLKSGAKLSVFLIGKSSDLKGDALINLKSLVRCGGKVIGVNSVLELKSKIVKAVKPQVIVDALFGTGLKKKVKGIYGKVIDYINEQDAKVIGVDVPSGLDSDTGEPLGKAVVADVTVTFGYPKLGLVIGQAYKYTGDVLVADILLPEAKIPENESISLITAGMVKSLFKPRVPDSHKGSYGHVLVVAGSCEKSGAAKLAAVSALRSGAGLVTLALPRSAHDIVKGSLYNAMSIPVDDDGEGHFTSKGIKKIIEFAQDKDAVAIGPGLNQSKTCGDLIIELIRDSRVRIVVDADGLNSLQGRLGEIQKGRDGILFTPHPGEMSRLTGKTVSEIQKDRIGSVRAFISKYGVGLVLKGFRTVVGFRGGSIYINPTGNPGMAVAGMGDVLTGIAASYISQQDDFKKAVLSAVFNHGLLGDLVAAEYGERGLLATDLVDRITKINKTLYPGNKLIKIQEL